jgi:hypothetical protein
MTKIGIFVMQEEKIIPIPVLLQGCRLIVQIAQSIDNIHSDELTDPFVLRIDVVLKPSLNTGSTLQYKCRYII